MEGTVHKGKVVLSQVECFGLQVIENPTRNGL